MYYEKKENLVDILAKKGIKNQAVLEAIKSVDRHLFLPENLREQAYVDHALPIGEGQTISQPYTVAVMTELLEVADGNKVLEIGTGSGYQSVILASLGCDVYTIERIKSLYEYARDVFTGLNQKIHQFLGDGTLGLEEEAPFDRIIVTAGAPTIPDALKTQLKIGGKLVIPVGNLKQQKLTVITKIDSERYGLEELPGFVFVPLIGQEAWKTELL